MKKILYLNNFEAPYRVPFFNLLGKKYDVTLALSESNEEQEGRDEKWFANSEKNYKTIHLKTRKFLGKKICFDVKKMINDYDLVFMDMYGNPTNMYAIHRLRKKKIPFVMSVDGMLFREKEKFLVKKLKKYFLTAPQKILSPSKYTDDVIKGYGVKSEDICRYHFTSLEESDIKKAQELKNSNKEQLREKLNIKEDKVVLFVGRFIYGKGIDVLIKASKMLSNNVGVYIVGGNPTKEYLDLVEKLNLINVHFVDFQKKDELANYFAISDLFVLPTRTDVWGLVINEAMAYGLPVITTNRCVAGIELVDDENGYLMKVDDVETLSIKMKEIIENDDLLTRLGEKSLERIKEYTIEEMASAHIKVFDSILNID